MHELLGRTADVLHLFKAAYAFQLHEQAPIRFKLDVVALIEACSSWVCYSSYWYTFTMVVMHR